MNFIKNKTTSIVFKIILFCLLAYPPIFLHLDTLPIRIWDESRLAINAYEMHKDGDFLVTHYMGNPDMWNTKPPLMIWLQVFFIKLIGTGELSIRLPSAIAAFLTCIAILYVAIKYIKDYWFGLIAILILVTSHGYINLHATRTGDYDALLTFFTTVFCFSYFLFIKNNSQKYLHLFFIALALSVLTKSIQGFFFLPALLIYTLTEKKIICVLKNKWLWIDLILSTVIITGYYLLRESNNPGYLQAVWDNELGGRYLEVNEGHGADFWYYYHNFIAFQFSLWYWLIPCGLMLGLALKDQLLRSITFFSVIAVLSYLLIASTAKTKLEWYDVPLYPFLAILGTIIIYWLFLFLKNSNYIVEQFKINTAPYVFLFFIFLTPYMKIIDKVYEPKEYDWDKEFYFISSYLQGAIQLKNNIYGQSLCYDGVNSHLLFYVNILNEKGQKIKFADWNALNPGDVVITSQPHIRSQIENNYSCDVVSGYYGIITYKIHGTKSKNS